MTRALRRILRSSRRSGRSSDSSTAGRHVIASATAERSYFQYYCFKCHSGPSAQMGMEIDKLDTANVEKNAERWEKVVRNLRAG